MPLKTPTLDAKRALRFVVLIGIVNCFADLTYEGARGVGGAFLGHLGASGAAIGAIAGGGELAGYAIRSVSGAIADRTGRYWIETWAGYVINMLCVPTLALVGSWPAAAGLIIGERVGRGIRKPVVSAVLAQAGTQLGSGRVFGVNEALDQTGATLGPLVVAAAIARGGFTAGFGVLIVPALLTLAFLALANVAGRTILPHYEGATESPVRNWPLFRRYAIGGALIAAGYVDFALIAFRFARDHVVSVPAISIWFAVAMAVGAIASPILGQLFDRWRNWVIVTALVVTAAATPCIFLGHGMIAGLGIVLWGLAGAVQSTPLLALVAGVVTRRRGATGFGLYDLIFGVAWFAGSAIAGILLDRSVTALVLFSTLLQLAAVPFFVPRRAAARV